jgi:hypothetical protein
MYNSTVLLAAQMRDRTPAVDHQRGVGRGAGVGRGVGCGAWAWDAPFVLDCSPFHIPPSKHAENSLQKVLLAAELQQIILHVCLLVLV